MTTFDFTLEDHGAIWLLTPISEKALHWIEEQAQIEPWQWYAKSVVVGTRDVGDIAERLLTAGLSVFADLYHPMRKQEPGPNFMRLHRDARRDDVRTSEWRWQVGADKYPVTDSV